MNKLRKNKKKADVPSTSEWSRTGSLMYKPEMGWIHADAQLSPDAGICYGVRYIGCLEIKESMKALDFETRTAIARESIKKVAEAAGLKTASKQKKTDRHLEKMLGNNPHMQNAGANINLTITTESITLMIMESGEIIAEHPLHVVSFASGGDVDTLDFVSYVAKDHEYGRACHVLECGGGLAEDVVTTIGQAFELRFKQYLNRQPKAVQITDRQGDNPAFVDESWGNREDYYNDTPDAVPPESDVTIESSSSPVIPPLPGYTAPNKADESIQEKLNIGSISRGCELDNKGEVSEPADSAKSVKYDNRSHLLTEVDINNQSIDAFDMEPFSVNLPPAPEPPPSSMKSSHRIKETDLRENKAAPSTESLEPVFEEWYHGDLQRKQAESFLEFDGDFLVRKSANSPGQFVLSGKQAGAPRHLLLVDPEGIVRTRDFIFDSVSHLINYHRQNSLPILTQGSELQLVRPVKACISAI
ncbi:hypothetical protein BsWGS_05554 [Bradybaena similaris]